MPPTMVTTPKREPKAVVAELEETLESTREASASSVDMKKIRNAMKRARLAILHLDQSRLASSASVSTSTESLDGFVQQYQLTLPPTGSTAASASSEAEHAIIEEVRVALCGLCERAEGSIVQLHDLSKHLSDANIIKLGGIPGEARERKSKSNDKRKYISRLTTHLECIFDVVVRHNDTGEMIAGQSGFKGPYALSLRMIK